MNLVLELFRVQKAQVVFKNAQPTGFLGALRFIGFSEFFYLNEQFRSLLVYLAFI